MGLRLVRRPGSDRWYLRGTVRGISIYESAGTGERGAAEEVRTLREAELLRQSIHGVASVATFAHAAESYLTAEPRSPGTCALVARLLTHFGTMPLRQVGQEQIDRAYRAILRPGASPATKLRNVLVPTRAIMEHAAIRGWCPRPAFDAPRQPRPRVAFLTPPQAAALIAGAEAHLRPLLAFLLSTGARMSEALELDWRHVDLHAKRAELVKTKTGRARHVDLTPNAVAALAGLSHREGRVFRPVYSVRRDGTRRREGAQYLDTGRTSGGQIKTGWATACRRAGLPGAWVSWTTEKGGQRKRWVAELHPHDLRHTWATWHYATFRDLLRLQAAGGWSGVAQVQGYAHLLPEVYAADAAAWLGVAKRSARRQKAG